jgi:hypothetical protein
MGLVSAATPQVPIPIIRGQVNRVPEPAQPDYVIMWPLMRGRLATNSDSWVDSYCTGFITNNVLTVTAVGNGIVAPGQTLYVVDQTITAGCYIMSQLTGTPGGIGTYQTTPTLPITSDTIYCGTAASIQPTEHVIQVDVHGPGSADNAQRISTLWFDQFSVTAFVNLGLDIAPLYATDPRQLAFANGEQQYEDRWSIDLHMQVNPIVTVTQQFADQAIAILKPIEVYYPT